MKNTAVVVKSTVIISLVLFVGATGYYVRKNEINGTCDRIQSSEANLQNVQKWFVDRDVNLADLSSMNTLNLKLKYGDKVADEAYKEASAQRSYADDLRSLTGLKLCFD